MVTKVFFLAQQPLLLNANKILATNLQISVVMEDIEVAFGKLLLLDIANCYLSMSFSLFNVTSLSAIITTSKFVSVVVSCSTHRF